MELLAGDKFRVPSNKTVSRCWTVRTGHGFPWSGSLRNRNQNISKDWDGKVPLSLMGTGYSRTFTERCCHYATVPYRKRSEGLCPHCQKRRQNHRPGAHHGRPPRRACLSDQSRCQENDVVIVSDFVNPTQFGPSEDYDAYPRKLAADEKVAEAAGATAIFAPSPAEMYPHKDMTWVEVTGNITKVLCGRTRPIHFRGVATVCTKLFNLSQADRAYFGLKDAQQTEVLRRMVENLFMNVELRIMPIVRESDGLAKSSRNVYLSPEERKAALILSRSLKHAKEAFAAGEKGSPETGGPGNGGNQDRTHEQHRLRGTVRHARLTEVTGPLTAVCCWPWP